VANTLTSLIPDLYEAMDVVSREMVGMIPSVSRDHTIARAAVGQQVRSFVVPATTASDIVPGVTPPNDGDQTLSNVSMTITKARRVPIRWNGEEELGVNNGGPGVMNIRANQMAQSMRTLVNEIESDLCALYTRASRSYGTPGSAPFATSLADPAQIRKILSDNGAPMGDLQMVINTTAGANMRALAQLNKANESADTSMLRRGVLLDIHGFAIRESAQVKTPTKGTGASYVTSGVSAIGATSITLATGTGTVLAGDTVVFTGDPNKYVVSAGVAAPGVLTIAAPGLLTTVASGTAVTVSNTAAQNMAFARTAIALATRLPALPSDGDAAVDRTTITDPVSGLAFEVAMYAQYRQMQYEISAAWGVGVFKPEHFALLLG
jgi:hypothetical protein